MPLQLFLTLNIIAAACKNSFSGIFDLFFFYLTSLSGGGGRKQKFLKERNAD
jgi:hypothetical protein